MKILLNDHYEVDVKEEAKHIAKENGFKEEDIGYVKLIPCNWEQPKDKWIVLRVSNKDNKRIGLRAY